MLNFKRCLLKIFSVRVCPCISTAILPIALPSPYAPVLEPGSNEILFCILRLQITRSRNRVLLLIAGPCHR